MSLSLSPAPKKRGVRVAWCISIPPGVRTILHGTEEVRCIHWATTMGYLHHGTMAPWHHALHSSSPCCHPLSCISSFAWGCVQQCVKEPRSVPGYRVRLPEERSLEQSQEVCSACQPHMHAIASSAYRGGHRSMPFCCRTVEDRLPLERVPLACTFGSPLDLHVRQSLGLQGQVDLDHHRVELLIAHLQWFPMVVHNLATHPGVMWLVQSDPDLLIAGPGHFGQFCFNCLQSFVRNGVQLTKCLHLETLAFLLRLDLLWGWLDVCVRAIPLLVSSLFLLRPPRRHDAWVPVRDRTRRSAAWCSPVRVAAHCDRTRLVCCRLYCDKTQLMCCKLCVRTQVLQTVRGVCTIVQGLLVSSFSTLA